MVPKRKFKRRAANAMNKIKSVDNTKVVKGKISTIDAITRNQNGPVSLANTPFSHIIKSLN